MDPVEALDRIVYLLDRELAPAPKVKAFLRAARRHRRAAGRTSWRGCTARTA